MYLRLLAKRGMSKRIHSGNAGLSIVRV